MPGTNLKFPHVTAAIIAAICALMGLPSLLYPHGPDQGMFSYIGQTILLGGLPYVDAWDIKPPGVFYIYALGQFLFRDVILAPRIMDLICVAIISYLLILVARNFGNWKAGAIAAFLYASCYWLEFNFSATAQAESFAAPFLLLSLHLVQTRSNSLPSILIAGILVGFMVTLKTTFLLLAIVPFLALIQSKPGWKAIVTFVLGGVVPGLAFFLIYLVTGHTRELQVLIEAQAAYAQSEGGFDAKRFRQVVFGIFEFFPITHFLTFFSLLSMILVKSLRRQWVLWIWILAYWAQMILQNKYFLYHFVPWLLPITLISGLALKRADELLLVKLPKFRFTVVALACGLFGLLLVRNVSFYIVPIQLLTGRLQQDRFDRLFIHNFYWYPQSKKAAQMIRQADPSGGPIIAYCFDPALYLMSERRSVSQHFTNAFIRLEGWIPDSIRKEFFQQLEEDVRAQKPKVLVTDYQIDWGIEELTTDPEGPIKFCGLPYDHFGTAQHLYVYRLKEQPE